MTLISPVCEQELPELPASLELLDCKLCNVLQQLPQLAHTSMGFVNCSNCPMVRELPGLPATLHCLSVRNLPQLQVLPHLPTTLQSLQISDSGKQCYLVCVYKH